MKEIEAVVLAGGRGQRMGELVSNRQKCLLEVDGKPILTHVFDNTISSFGSANVTVVLGYHGEDVIRQYGNRYRSLLLSYVGDPRPLETKRRLLLAKENIQSPFLFLAGDVLCDPKHLVKIADQYEEEGRSVFGTISCSSFHSPGLSHPLITIEGDRAIQLIFPPTPYWKEEQFRMMDVAYYSQDFIRLLESARKEVQKFFQVISLALEQGNEFQASKYLKKWYHFFEPDDLKIAIDREYRL